MAANPVAGKIYNIVQQHINDLRTLLFSAMFQQGLQNKVPIRVSQQRAAVCEDVIGNASSLIMPAILEQALDDTATETMTSC
mmetsp:Transcript_2040/g.4287  ORF Transcript_2040/g.4287 Transcript_2040/m.4287 type:complete len:82 (-) Transcript_2040:544-789(-)